MVTSSIICQPFLALAVIYLSAREPTWQMKTTMPMPLVPPVPQICEISAGRHAEIYNVQPRSHLFRKATCCGRPSHELMRVRAERASVRATYDKPAIARCTFSKSISSVSTRPAWRQGIARWQIAVLLAAILVIALKGRRLQLRWKRTPTTCISVK
jgi:hypothetical protein